MNVQAPLHVRYPDTKNYIIFAHEDMLACFGYLQSMLYDGVVCWDSSSKLFLDCLIRRKRTCILLRLIEGQIRSVEPCRHDLDDMRCIVYLNDVVLPRP